MLEYPRWKYLLVAAVLLLAMLFALPNFFGEDPSLQVARKDHNAVTSDSEKELEGFLKERNIPFGRSYIDNGRLMVRFANVPEQLAARDAVNDKYTGTYITALSFAPRTPEFLRTLGLRPMPLGLDLRGGLYLLYQVDVNAAVAQALEGYAQDARRALAPPAFRSPTSPRRWAATPERGAHRVAARCGRERRAQRARQCWPA
jgi:preprotein translocase subunit SecD